MKRVALFTCWVGSAWSAQVHGAPRAQVQFTPEHMLVVDNVILGKSPCEPGGYVIFGLRAGLVGRFGPVTGREKHQMTPMPTSSAAARLEDAASGAVWLQFSDKSMLMNRKKGQPMTDDCMNTGQTRVAQGSHNNPALQLLDAPALGTAGLSDETNRTSNAFLPATS